MFLFVSGASPPSTSTHNIRVVSIDDQPWFVGMDICNILGFSSPKDAYSRLDDSEKCYEARTLLGMNPGKKLVLVSESGLYKLIMRSDKPQAKDFQDLVTKEILPRIRKTGAYVTATQ